ncbi:hypothetical protein AcW1_001625 [Taiwanofungus camphoratus]|nr:hypothetical protein AcV7_003523 [Antrodia cinnamomea]KAI0938715.1 hypothetical protein AcV5_000332 [Antrodia cinnamomea]KAI0945391.1 hypothetical protein AcW1_001625 [Antrodia cinnamomea]
MTLRSPTYRHTHVVPIFVSLLLANLLQAVATIMDLKWLLDGAVEKGHFCSVQGGIKNAGNVAMALWSFLLSLHVFMLLFLRWRSTKLLCHIILVLGWLLVALVPGIGPLAIQTAERGPYFGPSGYWCWITHNYSKEQTFLEYFFEFISAGFSFILYTAIFLRVRGNLVVIDGKWCIRFVPRRERWLLAVSRDATDSSMMHVAARMVWHPVGVFFWFTICQL